MGASGSVVSKDESGSGFQGVLPEEVGGLAVSVSSKRRSIISAGVNTFLQDTIKKHVNKRESTIKNQLTPPITPPNGTRTPVLAAVGQGPHIAVAYPQREEFMDSQFIRGYLGKMKDESLVETPSQC